MVGEVGAARDPFAPLAGSPAPTKRKAKPKITPVIPAPVLRAEDVPPIKLASGEVISRPPDLHVAYKNQEGDTCGYVCRWNLENGRKEIRPIIWDGERWVWQGLPGPYPLLNCDVFTKRDGPVLVVEGEKTCLAAERLLETLELDHFTAATWHGGAGAIGKVDWSTLRGRAVVVWGDADEPGQACAQKIAAKLWAMDIKTAIVAVPPGLPAGWDLADPLTDPINDLDTVRDLIEVALESLYREPATDASDAPPVHGPVNGEGPPILGLTDASATRDIRGFEPLGYNLQTLYLIPHGTQQIHSYAAGELLTQGALVGIQDQSIWRAAYHFTQDRSIPIPKARWAEWGQDVIQACYKRGVFTERKIRGIGVWRDRNHVVVNTGNRLLVDGAEIEPSELAAQSSWVYPRGEPRLRDLDLASPLDDGAAVDILRACRAASWSKPLYGDLLAGWIATAIICGVFAWRTHVWITGPKNSGKSTLISDLIQRALGDFPEYSLGVTSAAGIRSHIANDARPVIYDEAEGDIDSRRRQEVIQLMRAASSDGPGRILKGTSDQSGKTFEVRSSFLLASIGVGITEGADLRRTCVLTLRKDPTFTAEQRAASESAYANMRARFLALPSEGLAEKLFLRQVNMVPVIHKSVEVLVKAFAQQVGSRAVGDQLGMLLAGAYSLVSPDALTESQAESYVRNHDWSEYIEHRESDEDEEVLRHLMAQILRVQGNAGVLQRTVGELMAITGGAYDPKVPKDEADRTLRMHGFNFEMRRERDDGDLVNGFWIANKHANLDELMKDSPFPEGYVRILARNKSSQASVGPMRFAGARSRAIWLPSEILIGGFRAETRGTAEPDGVEAFKA